MVHAMTYDEITVVVYDNIEVINFSDDVCSGDNTQYYVTFNVVDSDGNPVSFYVNTGTGDIPYVDYFAGTFGSNTIYNITVTDAHNCSLTSLMEVQTAVALPTRVI
jgi:hypothetical protein